MFERMDFRFIQHNHQTLSQLLLAITLLRKVFFPLNFCTCPLWDLNLSIQVV